METCAFEGRKQAAASIEVFINATQLLLVVQQLNKNQGMEKATLISIPFQ